MAPDLDLKGSSGDMEILTTKENESTAKDPIDQHMNCVSNCEDTTFEIEDSRYEQTLGAKLVENLEVNIMECTDSGENPPTEAKSEDATEDSSSFDNSASGLEDGSLLSDAEVESELRGDATPSLEIDGFRELFRTRKKRLTSHWRTYIRPLMWRCKWVELQIKKFRSQALKYDSELAKYNQRKQFKFEGSTLDLGSKSLPFSGHTGSIEVMKRRKRKRVEDTMDIAAYMSEHNLFSYYDKRRSNADFASLDDDWGNLDKKINSSNNFGISDEMVSLQFRDGDNSLEQILWKIGVVQSQVSELKTRVDKVMSENAGKFSSTDTLRLLIPCNALVDSARYSTSPPNNDERILVGTSCIASQLIPECYKGDLVMPEAAVSSHGEVTHLPDIIESTDQPKFAGSCQNTGDGALMGNYIAKEEPEEKLQVPKKEQESIPLVVQVPGPLPIEDQRTPKIRSIAKITDDPKSKRKRGRRKAGRGRWSRRSSG